MANDDPSDGGEGSAREEARVERLSIYPDDGFVLAKFDEMRPPGEALSAHYTRLKLTALEMPATTEFTDYVIYDADGHSYSPASLRSMTEDPDAEQVETLVEEARADDVRSTRRGLFGLAEVADAEPELAIDAAPFLTETLGAGEPDVRAMALEALATLAETYPAQVTPASADVVAFLDPDADARLQPDAIEFVASVGGHDPGAVVDAAPKLGVFVQDDTATASRAIVALQRIADRYPDAVVPAASALEARLGDDGADERVGTLAVLGKIAKEYPDIAESTLPVAEELLAAESDRLRSNAAALFADLTDEYPEEIRRVVPRAIELLGDPDERARYNATSILAGLAEPFPEDVEPAIGALVETLEADFEYSRSNACWALGYLKADDALDRLVELAESDPSETVRAAAAFAVREIRDR